MSNSVRLHRRQPIRLPRPWDSPGKNTGVGCHFLLQCMKVKIESEVSQSCPTLSDPMDCSLPGSSVHGIFQARVLQWVAIAFSRGDTLGPSNSASGNHENERTQRQGNQACSGKLLFFGVAGSRAQGSQKKEAQARLRPLGVLRQRVWF